MTLWAVVLAFAAAAVAPLIHRLAGRFTGLVLGLFALGLFVLLLVDAPGIVEGRPSTAVLQWAPLLDLDLAFRADGLGLLMALLVTGVGAAVAVYSGAYMAGQPRLGYFYTALMLFLASMLGVVLVDNVIALYVFWELTSVSSFMLIGFEHEKADARAAAQQALLVTVAGGLALLGGVVLLALAGGSWSLSELLLRGDEIREDARYLPALLLILVAAFTKSAQVPLHFWLPNAMVAPTPVSAYLHSATMVKAGVFLLARFHPALGGTVPWTLILSAVGAATMLYAGVLAVQQRDLKRILAYTTVSSLGVLTLLAGVGTDVALKGFAAWLLAHALYKGALFMVAGSIDHATGTRDVTRLGGLARALPLTAAAAVLAGLSMSGIPPLLGFVAKEELYATALDLPRIATAAALTAAFVAMAALTLLAAAIVIVGPLFGAMRAEGGRLHAGESVGFWLPALALAAVGAGLGVAAAWTGEALVAPAAEAMSGAAVEVSLHAVPVPGAAFALSALGIALGVLAYPARAGIRRMLDRAAAAVRWTADEAYDATVAGLEWVARVHTVVLQSGRLTTYLIIILVTTLVLVGSSLVAGQALRMPDATLNLRAHEVGIAVLIVMAAGFAAVTSSRLAAVAALGVVGYGAGLVWVLYGAPDLAMTQFLIETLTVLLMLFVFSHLPPMQPPRPRRIRARDALIAGAFGAMVTGLMLLGINTGADRPMADFYRASSYPLAEGRNVVNVILVDFRALDTLGEITVLATAAFGVAALLHFRRNSR